jgi:hypothetical protein
VALEKFLVFSRTLVFRFALLVLIISLAFLKFIKLLLMVVLTIHLFVTLCTVIDLRRRDRTNRTLVMISHSEIIMLFFLNEIMDKL